jgi:hypothetical protein
VIYGIVNISTVGGEFLAVIFGQFGKSRRKALRGFELGANNFFDSLLEGERPAPALELP